MLLRHSFAALSACFLALGISAVPNGPAQAAGVHPTFLVVQRSVAAPMGAKSMGAAPATARVRGAVMFTPRHDSTLANEISRMTQPGSPSFHDYLTRPEYRRSFGPSPETIARTRRLLRHSGLHIAPVAKNGLLLPFHGTVAAAESAFHTTLDRFQLSGHRVGQATSAPIRLPATLAPKVTAVLGLNTTVRERSNLEHAPASMYGTYPAAKHDSAPRIAAAPNACDDAKVDARISGGLTDSAIARSYGADPLYRNGDTGAGQTVAIYELEPYLRSDIKTFDQCYFGNAAAAHMMARLHTINVDGGEPAGQGSGEALLDIEDVAALAPGATIDVYVGAPSSYGAIDTANAIVADDKASIVTTSWGLCEQAMERGLPGQQQAENYIFQESAAQGMTTLNATGDTGDNECNGYETSKPVKPILSAGDPASQPYVVGVAGTTIDDAGQPPLERVWNDGPNWGAGTGGLSQSWEMPAWQNSPMVPGIHSKADKSEVTAAEKFMGFKFCQSAVAGHPSVPCRQTPDVSAQADEFTGAVTVYAANYGWTTIGGTSSASPLWAGMLALVNASPTCASHPATKHGVGFALPLLYAVASNPAAYAASFNDITKGNNDVYDLDNGKFFPARKGYDMATGLGSPQLTTPTGGHGLAYYLCSFGSSHTSPVIGRLSPSHGSVHGGNTVMVHGRGFASSHGTGRFSSDVSGVTVGSVLLPRKDVKVESANMLRLTMPKAAELDAPHSSADGAGPAAVSVTLDNGHTSGISSHDLYVYVDTKTHGPKPSVFATMPYGGSEAKAAKTMITGANFATKGRNKVTKVTFGGVKAKTDRITRFSITVTPPAFHVSGKKAEHCVTDRKPTKSVCQVQVRVFNAAGASKVEEIRKTYQGQITYNSLYIVAPPPGCHCEVYPVASEYDYFPAPEVTSVSTSKGPAAYASEQGATEITLRGRGFNPEAVASVYFGSPGKQGFTEYQQYFPDYMTGTTIRIEAPYQNPTIGPISVPVTVWTLAGYSHRDSHTQATYAGRPEVSRVSHPLAIDTGGTSETIVGKGLKDVTHVRLTDVYPPPAPPFSYATVYQFKIVNGQKLTFLSPGTNPGYVYLQLCTATGCNRKTSSSVMTIYPPGNPSVASSTPASGPAQGGTNVAISGKNLGCALAVYFGSTPSAAFHNAAQYLSCGRTDRVIATAPPGTAGSTVNIYVQTAEAKATGYGLTKASTAATFTYQTSAPSRPTDLTATPGSGSVDLAWNPPASNGGDPVTGYMVTYYEPGGPATQESLPASQTSDHVTGLTSGQAYKFIVIADSSAGTGLPATVWATPK